MKKIKLSLITFAILLASCETCDLQKACDLAIPIIVDLYDSYGQPMIDNYGNQAKGHNELYYNERTGEWFNSDYAPQYGLLVGDIIQVGTQIFNNYVSTECEKSKDAGSSNTQPQAHIQLANGQQANINLETFMPTGPIKENESKWTATKIQFYGSGNYGFDFNANYDGKLDELNYNNNLYNSNAGNYGKNSQFGFFVAENPSFPGTTDNINEFVQSYNAPKTIIEMEEMEIMKFVNSPKYAQWLQSKIALSSNK